MEDIEQTIEKLKISKPRKDRNHYLQLHEKFLLNEIPARTRKSSSDSRNIFTVAVSLETFLAEQRRVNISSLANHLHQFFVCRVIAPWTFQPTAVVIEDLNRQFAARLVLDDCDTKNILATFPSGTVLAIKYSRFRLSNDEEFTIRCTDLKDLVPLSTKEAGHIISNLKYSNEYRVTVQKIKGSKPKAPEESKKSRVFPRTGNANDYNMMEILQKPSNFRHYCEDFNVAIARRSIEGKGMGLIAMEPIAQGQLVMASKAFAIVFWCEENPCMEKSQQLFNRVVNEVTNRVIRNLQARKEFCELYAGPDFDCDRFVDGSFVGVKRIESACQYNAFSVEPTRVSPTDCVGLWLLASFMNHSCYEYTCEWSCHGNLMLIRTVKPVAEGEELTISYLSLFQLYGGRKDVLKGHFGISCLCRLCEFDRQLTPSLQVRRLKWKHEEVSKKIEEMMCVVTEVEKFLGGNQLLLAQHWNLFLNLGRLCLEKDYFDKSKLLFERCFELIKELPCHELSALAACNLARSWMITDGPKNVNVVGWIEELKKCLLNAYGSIEVLQILDFDCFLIFREYGLL